MIIYVHLVHPTLHEKFMFYSEGFIIYNLAFKGDKSAIYKECFKCLLYTLSKYLFETLEKIINTFVKYILVIFTCGYFFVHSFTLFARDDLLKTRYEFKTTNSVIIQGKFYVA